MSQAMSSTNSLFIEVNEEDYESDSNNFSVEKGIVIIYKTTIVTYRFSLTNSYCSGNATTATTVDTKK